MEASMEDAHAVAGKYGSGFDPVLPETEDGDRQ